MKHEIYGSGEKRIEITILGEPMEGLLAGIISSPLFEDTIPIGLDSREDTDYDFACLAWMKGGSKPRIYMMPELVELLREGCSEAKTILFHEIGHFVHKDFLDKKTDSSRSEMVKNGLVCETELAADDFAVAYLGKEVVLDGLKSLVSRIKGSYSATPGEGVEVAIKEVELRIAYLNRNRWREEGGHEV